MKLCPFLSCISPPIKQNRKEKRPKVYLNIYDVTPANKYLYWLGLGIHHSGIEVHGVEYAFGGDKDPTSGDDLTSGVFEVKPRRCPGYTYRRSILLGTTDMSGSEFSSFMKHISKHYHGNTYDLFAKNCNHFTDEVCQHLVGKPIPGWVNRLARVDKARKATSVSPPLSPVFPSASSVNSGCFIESLLPESKQATSMSPYRGNQTCSEDEKDSRASPVTGKSKPEEVEHLLRRK